MVLCFRNNRRSSTWSFTRASKILGNVSEVECEAVAFDQRRDGKQIIAMKDVDQVLLANERVGRGGGGQPGGISGVHLRGGGGAGPGETGWLDQWFCSGLSLLMLR